MGKKQFFLNKIRLHFYQINEKKRYFIIKGNIFRCFLLFFRHESHHEN